jgi:hypothetical protein
MTKPIKYEDQEIKINHSAKMIIEKLKKKIKRHCPKDCPYPHTKDGRPISTITGKIIK